MAERSDIIISQTFWRQCKDNYVDINTKYKVIYSERETLVRRKILKSPICLYIYISVIITYVKTLLK